MGSSLAASHRNFTFEDMGQVIGFVLFFSLFWFYPSQCQTEKCCSTKVVNNSPDSSLDGTYTLASDGEKRQDICIDACVYTREGLEYCFISKPEAESADVVCDGGSAGSGGSATTQSLDSLSDAADQAKEEADKAADEIAAADAAINAASDAANALDQLDLSKFTTSGSRFKRQNDNNIVTDANLNLVIESESESFTSSSDNAGGAGAQIVSNSVTESSSSANDVPTTCANLLKLMDEITETLTNNPAGVTPLMTALSAIVTPLAEPCSPDDITELTTKKNTAKTTADTAVAEQKKIKAAATEKYDAANEKLTSLNEQIAAQGGSAGSGAAGGKVCDFPNWEDVAGQQLYTIPIEMNEASLLLLVFKDARGGDINLKFEDHPEIVFMDSETSPGQRMYMVSITDNFDEPIPAGTYSLEVSSGNANAEGYTPWTTPPLLWYALVNGEYHCTPGPAPGKVCDFPKEVTGQKYTIPNIKTNEADTLKFVFEKPKAGLIFMRIVDPAGPLIAPYYGQPIFWECSTKGSETECESIINPVPAGTYTIEVSSGAEGDEGYTPWTTPPLLKTFSVGGWEDCIPAA